MFSDYFLFIAQAFQFRRKLKGFDLPLIMLLVANFAITKLCKKPLKWLKPWHMGTHLRVLSENCPINTNMTGLRWFSKIFAFLFFG